MGRRGRSCCCTTAPLPCASLVCTDGVATAGDHGTVCGNWFTPSPYGDYRTSLVYSQPTVYLNGIAYASYVNHGQGGVPWAQAPQPYSIWLWNPPTVAWSLDYERRLTVVQSGETFHCTLPQEPGWIANCWTGKVANIGGRDYVIRSNTTDSFTLSESEGCPYISCLINFKYWQDTGFTVTDAGVITFLVTPVGWFDNQLVGHNIDIRTDDRDAYVTGTITSNTSTSMTVSCQLPTTHGGDFSIAGNVLTPSIPPTAWVGGATYEGSLQGAFRNRYVELLDAQGVVQYRPQIDYFSTTSLYIYSPLPPEGTYTGWTWRIVEPFKYWGWRILGLISGHSGLPSVVDGAYIITNSVDGSSYGWLGGEFVGCSVTYDGVTGTVISNEISNGIAKLVVSTESPSFGPRACNLKNIPTSGNCSSCGNILAPDDNITPEGYAMYAGFTSYMVGLHITIEGSQYTIVSVGNTSITMDRDIPRDYAWKMIYHIDDAHWDMVDGQFTSIPILAGIRCDQIDSKILWHSPIRNENSASKPNIYMYELG